MRNWHAYVRERLHLPGLSPEREAEAVEEIALQLEDVARSASARGASESEANAIAERHVPDWTVLATDLMRTNRPHRMPADRRLGVGFTADLLYALRMLRTQRAFTIVAALTLAVGIGATSALFSVVDAVLLRPLPYRDPDRVVRLISIRANGEPGGISYPDFLDWQARNRTFERMAVYTSRNFALREADGVTQIRGAVVSADLFTVLGASPSLGRTFVPAEYAVGAPMTVVIGDRLWRERFGADPQVLGRTLEVDHKPATIVGVMPRGFEFPIETERAELWTTIAVDAGSLASQRGVHYLDGIGRLAASASLEQAHEELNAIVKALNHEHRENDPRSARVRPELAELVADVRSEWLALFAAAGCLLLIACANVVNMLLARAATRRKEFALRFALGAGRLRVIRQLLIEHAALGVFGAVLGLVFARWCIALLKQVAPPGVPRLDQAGLNPNAVLFAILISCVAIVLFGLIPALHASMPHPDRLATLGVRSQSDSAGARTRRALVIVQIAIAMVLLIGGALLIATVVHLQHVDPGFSAARVITFRIDLPDEYPAARERVFYDQLLERIRALPGVTDASAAYSVPLSGRALNTGVEVEGRPKRTSGDETYFNLAQPGLFQTLRTRILKGRDFTSHDDLTSRPVAIVNKAFARTYFNDLDPIGRHINPGIANGYDKAPLREIVGVVDDIHVSSLRTPPAPEVYVPTAQCPSIGNSVMVVRASRDPQDISRSAKSVVASVDRNASVSRVRTLEDYVSSTIVQPQFSSLLLGCFAVFSSALAALGLYGLIAYSVTQRTQEIGVRLALGAAPSGVLLMILRQGARIALTGIALGLAAALIVSELLTAFLYGVGPRDVMTFGATASLLFIVALVACAIPATRAMRVDPISALRDSM